MIETLIIVLAIIFILCIASSPHHNKPASRLDFSELRAISDRQRECTCREIHPIQGGLYQCDRCLSTYHKNSVMICSFCDNLYPAKNEYNYRDKGYCCKYCYEAAWFMT